MLSVEIHHFFLLIVIRKFNGYISISLYYLIKDRLDGRKTPEGNNMLDIFNANGLKNDFEKLQKRVLPDLKFVLILIVHSFRRSSLIFLFILNSVFTSFGVQASRLIGNIGQSIKNRENFQNTIGKNVEFINSKKVLKSVYL